MNKNAINSALLAISLLASPFCFAEAPVDAKGSVTTQYEIEKVHAGVTFTIRHLVGEVDGKFSDYTADISFNPKKLSESKVSATVQMASIDTGNADRDKHLKSDDFFSVEKMPTMTFVSKKITANGKEKYKMTGDLTMHGVTKPVTFDMKITGPEAGMDGTPRLGYKATAEINRKDYGVNWNKTLDKGGFVLGDAVQITLKGELSEKSGSTAKRD